MNIPRAKITLKSNTLDVLYSNDYFRFMILQLTFVFCIVGSYLFSQGDKLSLQGYYQGVNLLISNPSQQDGFGYCSYKATVNGDILPASTQKNIFEIDFKLFNINIGDPVFVVLEHALGCNPTFLNPESLKPKSTYECKNIKVNSAGLLQWDTYNENGKIDFVVEQFRWNKWVESGKVLGTGRKSLNHYVFQLKLHSGTNRIRVAQYDNTNAGRFSKEVIIHSEEEEIFTNGTRIVNKIYFSNSKGRTRTKYEIHDAYGNLLKLGTSDYVDCSNLVNGLYYVSFDNKTDKFFKIN